MGQGEILQFLIENEGQIFTAKEIDMALDLNSANPLSKLRKYPPEGFNSSKEHRLYGIKKGGGKTTYNSHEIYIYWYKKKER